MSSTNGHSIPQDIRLYVPNNNGWTATVKQNSTKEYCYFKNPGEDHFHLLVLGEVYLVRNDVKCCLSCALRLGFVTFDRLHWQHREKQQTKDFLV